MSDDLLTALCSLIAAAVGAVIGYASKRTEGKRADVTSAINGYDRLNKALEIRLAKAEAKIEHLESENARLQLLLANLTQKMETP